MSAERGVRAWSSAEWLAEAAAWIDRGLGAHGLQRVGDVERTRVRAWATVLRVPTDNGTTWFKACAEATEFEVSLYEVLVDVRPDWVLAPLASDRDRGWLLLPDGGPTLGDRVEGRARGAGLAEVLIGYGSFQRSLSDSVDTMLAAGVPDMRPQRMPERLDEALAAAASEDLSASDVNALRRVRDLAPRVAEWSAQLAASPLGASLDHNDLHPWNVLGDPQQPRLYDWGDSVVAHPLASALVPLKILGGLLAPPAVAAAREGYLEAFADFAPMDDVQEELEIACRLANIARSLTWERALRSSREQGEPIDPDFLDAPLQWLVKLLTD